MRDPVTRLCTRFARYLGGTWGAHARDDEDLSQRFEGAFRDLFAEVETADPIYLHKRKLAGAANTHD